LKISGSPVLRIPLDYQCINLFLQWCLHVIVNYALTKVVVFNRSFESSKVFHN
jgi:hypothetical protein